MHRKELELEMMSDSGKRMYLVKVSKDTYITGFNRHLHYSLMKDCTVANAIDNTRAACMCVKDILNTRWFRTRQCYYEENPKRIYYLSMEYYLGRALLNSLICLGSESMADEALYDVGLSLEEIEEKEFETALGTGGMGRLSACFLDSLASLGIPAYGYGIRYDYGMFKQHIKDGYQYEEPDNWLRHGNPWLTHKPEYYFDISFGGSTNNTQKQAEENENDDKPPEKVVWKEEENIQSTPYDIPIPGYRNDYVNTLRLWQAKAPSDFNFSFFDSEDYVKAIMRTSLTENLSRVLYPDNKFCKGKQLRLRQEYLLVASSLKDIVRRFKKSQFNTSSKRNSIGDMHKKVALQLNNTHCALAIPELMRILLDIECLPWPEAWKCTTKCLATTFHSLDPDSLEKWPVRLIQKVLPRHMEIIEEINRIFMDEVRAEYPENEEKWQRMSIITDEPENMVAMANLCIVGCHKVNGVSAVHTHILKTSLFKDLYDMYAGKFLNITNGVTARRWLLSCNPALVMLIIEHIGNKWLNLITELKKISLIPRMEAFCVQLQTIKQKNKMKFALYVKNTYGIEVDSQSIFDFHVKTIHEQKRQLLNIFHLITIYNRIRENPQYPFTPRTVFMAGKASPSYQKAKLIIKLFNGVAAACNNDPYVRNKLTCVFLADYNVSLAQKIMPAADLSEQISLAGTEASGTGCMKFMMNGALTIGTLDGANVEIREHAGEENFFLFGLTYPEVTELRRDNYHPSQFYNNNEELKKVIEMISEGHFSNGEPHVFAELVDSILTTDHYMVCADYESYIGCQEKVGEVYLSENLWTKMVAANISASGHFTSDRAILEYCEKVWNVEATSSKMKLS